MGMNEIELSPKGVVTWMVNGCGLSGATISASLGKERKYIHKYTSGGHIPTITVLAQIAAACGYDVHIIGHCEDIKASLEGE